MQVIFIVFLSLTGKDQALDVLTLLRSQKYLRYWFSGIFLDPKPSQTSLQQIHNLFETSDKKIEYQSEYPGDTKDY